MSRPPASVKPTADLHADIEVALKKASVLSRRGSLIRPERRPCVLLGL